MPFHLAETIPNKCQSAAACPISITATAYLTSTTAHVLLVTPATPCYIPPHCQAHSNHFQLHSCFSSLDQLLTCMPCWSALCLQLPLQGQILSIQIIEFVIYILYCWCTFISTNCCIKFYLLHWLWLEKAFYPEASILNNGS